jgi:hypothetical protein
VSGSGILHIHCGISDPMTCPETVSGVKLWCRVLKPFLGRSYPIGTEYGSGIKFHGSSDGPVSLLEKTCGGRYDRHVVALGK